MGCRCSERRQAIIKAAREPSRQSIKQATGYVVKSSLQDINEAMKRRLQRRRSTK